MMQNYTSNYFLTKICWRTLTFAGKIYQRV